MFVLFQIIVKIPSPPPKWVYIPECSLQSLSVLNSPSDSSQLTFCFYVWINKLLFCFFYFRCFILDNTKMAVPHLIAQSCSDCWSDNISVVKAKLKMFFFIIIYFYCKNSVPPPLSEFTYQNVPLNLCQFWTVLWTVHNWPFVFLFE